MNGYSVVQVDEASLNEPMVFNELFWSLDDAKTAVEDSRKIFDPKAPEAEWDGMVCKLYEAVVWSIQEISVSLQVQADKVASAINEFIDGCEYNETRQGYYPDSSEAEWGHLLYGKMAMLQELDPNLDWHDDESRFDIMDMSLFTGE